MKHEILLSILTISGISIGLGILFSTCEKGTLEKYDERQLIERGRGANLSMNVAFFYLLGLFAGCGFDLIRSEFLPIYAIFGLVITILTHDAYCIFHDAYLPQGRDTVKEIATYLFFGILWIVAMLTNRWRTGEDMLINGAFALTWLSRGLMLLVRAIIVGLQNRLSEKEEDDG